VFKDEKIYMPVPQQMGRGDKMGRGPYEKSGLVEDTSLPPGKEVKERFEIYFPMEEGKLLADEYEVNVKLWYLPYGTMNSDPFLWRDETRKVKVSAW
jgi:hypothetical protein